MENIKLKFSNLEEDNIRYIFKYLLFPNIELSDSILEVKFDNKDISSISIEGVSDDIFKEPKYKDLDTYQSLDIYAYFKGVGLLIDGNNIDEDDTVYYFINISKYQIDEEVIDMIFSGSNNKMLYEFNDNLSFFQTSSDSSNIHIVNDTDNEVSFLDIDDNDRAYNYLAKCLRESELISWEDYINQEYSRDISDFERQLSRYGSSSINDEYSHHLDTVIEDDGFFEDYDEFVESVESGGHSRFYSLVDEMYNLGKIPLSLKNSLFELDEESYNSITKELRGYLEIDNEDASINDSNCFTYSTGYTFYNNIYIDKTDIQSWGDEYNCYDWLTEDKLFSIIRENNLELDSSDLWQVYIGRGRGDYQQDIELTGQVYTEYSNVLKVFDETPELTYTNTKYNKKGVLGKTLRLLGTESNPDKDKTVSNYEKKIQYIPNTIYHRVASILGKYIDYDLNKTINEQQFKKIASKDSYLKRFTTVKDIQTLFSNYPKGFTVNDLKTLKDSVHEEGSLFNYLTKTEGLALDDFLHIDVVSYKWKSSLQTITNKYNYVFQLNLRKEYYDKVLDYFNVSEEIRQALKDYGIKKHSVHPVQNNSKFISLGWIRYTVAPTINYNKITLDGVLLDEVQSDLDNFEYFGRDIMKGWQYVIVKKFVSYVKKNLGYNKIYMPDQNVKADKYRAFTRDEKGNINQKYTANLLYKQLPSYFGFKPSEIEGFYLLEKNKTIKQNYLSEAIKYNKLIEGVIDLYNINDAGFARHNPKISDYCLKNSENLILALIFCVASQGVGWNIIASLFKVMYNQLLKNDSLYIKGKEFKKPDVYSDGSKERVYDAEEYSELLGLLGSRKIENISFMWKNREQIYSTTKEILKNWHYEDTSDKSKDAVMKLYDYYTSLKGLALPKAGFAVQLVTGALGCFDSVNTQLYSNEKIPNEIATELFTNSYPKEMKFNSPRESKDYEVRLKRLQAYSDFIDMLGKEVQKPTSERLWDIWVTIVADRLKNIFGTGLQKDRKTIVIRGEEELLSLNPYHPHYDNPYISDWEKEYSSIMTPDLVSKQHHPKYLAYGEYD